MLKFNTENPMRMSRYQAQKLRKLVLEYKSTITQEQLNTNSLADNIIDIQKELLKSSQRKIKSKILEYFIPYIEKKAQLAAQRKGVNIQDYTQNLYLKFLENLDNIVHNERFHITSLYKSIFNADCTDENFICNEHISLKDLTPQEELENSCELEEITFMQKAEVIIKILQKILSAEEFNILSLKANGNTYREIAEKIHKTAKQIERILYKSYKKINKVTVKSTLEDILFNGINSSDKSIVLEQFKFKTIKNTNTSDFNPKEIWQIVQKNRERLNIRKELDIMLKTQTNWKELLNNKSTQTKMRKKIKENPNFKFILKLDKKNNNTAFIREAKKISVALLEKNIFEFVE